MRTYLILQDPGHNRVFYTKSKNLCLAELQLACKSIRNVNCENIRFLSVANIDYFAFDTDEPLDDDGVEIISNLSFIFSLYQLIEIEEKQYLMPIIKAPHKYVDPKISTILKYPGKTNEIFTKMMINVGLLSSDFDYDDNIKLLDPIAGKGTTLYTGAVYGFNSYGIELEQKAVHDSRIFLKKYLEADKYKHIYKRKTLYTNKSKHSATMHEFQYAPNKDIFKDNAKRKTLSFIRGNCAFVSQYFKKNYFNLIVGDLPYGIAHGNSGKQRSAGTTRNPSELLEESLPKLHQVLKPGGVIVLSWNKHVYSRNDFKALLEKYNFEVLSDSPYFDFEHTVDASIKRDIIIGKKKR